MSAEVKGPTREIAYEMYEGLFNRGDNSILEKYVSEDFIYKNPIQDTVGRQQIIDMVDAQRDSFRNFKQNVDAVVVDKDVASMTVSWTVTGIHEKSFFGYPPSGNAISFSGITYFQWRDGQAVTAWGFSNMSEMLAT
jgi:steroid delta-isomerase-like uncharacterized protein